MGTHRTFPPPSPAPGLRQWRPPVSHEAYLWLVSEVKRLQRELAIAEASADHWYLRANYTREQLAEMYMRASQGRDENGAWLWPDSIRTTASGHVIETSSETRS